MTLDNDKTIVDETLKLELDRMGKYRILEPLGEGGMGIVYAAHDDVLKRQVAIKVLKSETLDSSLSDSGRDLRSRFMAEATAAAKLNSPHIVTVHDFGIDGENMYIVMEYLEGRTLADLIVASGGPLPNQRIHAIVRDVLSALETAHKAGVIHRDLKPSNIMILEDGRAKLMDFGIAHLEGSRLTRTGAMLGTPNYMSPEQVQGLTDIDVRSDIFSLGAVIYEMLSGGDKAFEGRSFHGITYKIVHADPVPVAKINPCTASYWRPLLERCLAKNREDRFANSREIATYLDRQSPVAAGSSSEAMASVATKEKKHRILQQTRREIGKMPIMNGDVRFMLTFPSLTFSYYWLGLVVLPDFLRRLSERAPDKTVAGRELRDAHFWKSVPLNAFMIVCHLAFFVPIIIITILMLRSDPIYAIDAFFWFADYQSALFASIGTGLSGMLLWFWLGCLRIEKYVEKAFDVDDPEEDPGAFHRGERTVASRLKRVLECILMLIANLAVFDLCLILLESVVLETGRHYDPVTFTVVTFGALLLVVCAVIQHSFAAMSVKDAALFGRGLSRWNSKAVNFTRYANAALILGLAILVSMKRLGLE